MDDIDEALARSRRELEALRSELAALREARGGRDIAELAATLRALQLETLELERRNAALDDALRPLRETVARLRARRAAGGSGQGP
jgi:prefoldin subunit 5